LQAVAITHVCERFLQHLVDSGMLSQGWRHWPATWLQEGGKQGPSNGALAQLWGKSPIASADRRLHQLMDKGMPSS